MTQCPKSGSVGKRMERVTLESLLRPEHLAHVQSEQWFFCPDQDCPVVYFDASGESLDKSTLLVRVGVKERDAPRPLCYCFDHSFEELQGDVARTGTSTIPDEITEKCRQGLHACEHKNPQGRCCLGTVRAALKDAQGSTAQPTTANGPDCCAEESDESSPPARPSAGRLVVGGALLTAILSSACCWLPLVLLVFGASAAGVAGIFEQYRPLLLGVSVVLLTTGFYFVYVRKPECEPGSACAVPNPRLAKMNKAVLWVATLFVAIFALFPNYVGVVLGTGDQDPVLTDEPYDLEFAVQGMTCEACAVTLRSELTKLQGVASAEVFYSLGQAKLRFESPGAGPARETIVKAVAEAGYTAVLP